MDKVQTPLQIQALGPESALAEWEWFEGLKRLDWFCFWLKGEEDPDPAKADQYTRWRELRKLQEATEAGQKPN